MVRTFNTLIVVLGLIAGLSCCAAIGLTVPAAAVGGGAAGVEYSLTNNAYKTLSYPLTEVRAAVNKALAKMRIRETKSEKEKDAISISAVTADLDIEIILGKVTQAVTKIEVSAKKGLFLKDKATATEIILQTEKSLEEKQ